MGIEIEYGVRPIEEAKDNYSRKHDDVPIELAGNLRLTHDLDVVNNFASKLCRWARLRPPSRTPYHQKRGNSYWYDVP